MCTVLFLINRHLSLVSQYFLTTALIFNMFSCFISLGSWNISAEMQTCWAFQLIQETTHRNTQLFEYTYLNMIKWRRHLRGYICTCSEASSILSFLSSFLRSFCLWKESMDTVAVGWTWTCMDTGMKADEDWGEETWVMCRAGYI